MNSIYSKEEMKRLNKTIPLEARPWGSKDHMEWRKNERLEGRMNQPQKGGESVRRFV